MTTNILNQSARNICAACQKDWGSCNTCACTYVKDTELYRPRPDEVIEPLKIVRGPLRPPERG